MPGVEPFWEAFWVLSSARQVSVGMGGVIEQPIAYAELSAYAGDHGFKAAPFWGAFLPTIQAMDRVYRSVQASKRAAEQPPAAAKGRRA